MRLELTNREQQVYDAWLDYFVSLNDQRPLREQCVDALAHTLRGYSPTWRV